MRTLLLGGHVYSPSEPFASALLVEGATVAWIGSDAGAEVHIPDVDQVVDLDGDLVAPCFVDLLSETVRWEQGFGHAAALPDSPEVVLPSPGTALRSLVRSGVPVALGVPADRSPWSVLSDAVYGLGDEGLSARAAFAAATRSAWRLLGDPEAGTLRVGGRADFARWRVDEIVVEAPDERISNWSTDPRSAVPGLPPLQPGSPEPTCVAVWVDGVERYRL